MKCENCGFISAKNYYKCPYCGKIHESENNVLNSNIRIGNLFSIRLRSLLLLIIANILLAALFVDIYFRFAWCITYWLLIVVAGAYVIFSSIAGKNSLITAVEKFVIYALAMMVIGIFAFKIDGLFDFRQAMLTMVLPISTIVGTALSFILLFVKTNKKFRPLWTEALLIFHLVVMVVIYICYIFAKYMPTLVDWGWVNWFSSYFLFDPAFTLAQGIIIYVALGLSLVYLINYNIVLFGHIIKEVKIQYGVEERD